MDFRHLKYFITVAEELNIGRAAARLHISQPPLTRQIQQLEEQLGVQLFVRTPKGVELTQAGALFLDEARNISTLLELAIERTKRAGQGKLGRLDIGIFGTSVLGAIPQILQRFRDEHPDVRVVLHTMSKHEQLAALRQRRITIGFNRMLTPQPDICTELIIQEPLFLAVNETHPLRQRPDLSFGDLAGWPLVLFAAGTHPNFVDRVIELAKTHRFTPEISQIVGDAIAAVALVAGGFGITLLPQSATALSLPGVEFLPFAHPCAATIDLSCQYRHGDESPILQAFLRVVEEFRLAQRGG